jgi:hypothetical protein
MRGSFFLCLLPLSHTGIDRNIKSYQNSADAHLLDLIEKVISNEAEKGCLKSRAQKKTESFLLFFKSLNIKFSITFDGSWLMTSFGCFPASIQWILEWKSM